MSVLDRTVRDLSKMATLAGRMQGENFALRHLLGTAVSALTSGHLYEASCPTDEEPTRRDSACYACIVLDDLAYAMGGPLAPPSGTSTGEAGDA